jgi:hypothetical protein
MDKSYSYNKYIKYKNKYEILKNVDCNSIGFIILRHVNNTDTNIYWIHCYNCIRKFYPENKILIIDDNSNDGLTHIELYNTTVINSEYPQRGELLPYYYYLHNKLFDTAVILHDSVFINKYIDFSVNSYKIIWEFEHYWDQVSDEIKMINVFNDEELTKFYKNKSLWKGCFGGMSIITHKYLEHINGMYPLNKLLDLVLTRYNRKSFERVFSVLLQKNNTQPSLLGNIHKYSNWGIKFKDIDKYPDLPIIKVWTGR